MELYSDYKLIPDETLERIDAAVRHSQSKKQKLKIIFSAREMVRGNYDADWFLVGNQFYAALMTSSVNGKGYIFELLGQMRQSEFKEGFKNIKMICTDWYALCNKYSERLLHLQERRGKIRVTQNTPTKFMGIDYREIHFEIL